MVDSELARGVDLIICRRTDAYISGSQISETVCKPPAFALGGSLKFRSMAPTFLKWVFLA